MSITFKSAQERLRLSKFKGFKDPAWERKPGGHTKAIWEQIPGENRFELCPAKPGDVVKEILSLSQRSDKVLGLKIRTDGLRHADSDPSLFAKFRRVLKGLKPVRRLPDLSAFTHLRCLDLSGSRSLKQLPDLSALIDLKSIGLSGCESLKSVPELSTATRLESLDLSGCSFHPQPDFSTLANLENLNLAGYGSPLGKLPDLSILTNLKSLNLSRCGSALHPLPDLSTLTNLESLDLSRCYHLTSLPDLSNLIHLKHLNLSDCRSLQELPAGAFPPRLESLDLSGCRSLRSLSGLPPLPDLKHLDLSECESLEDFPDFSSLTKLETLSMRSLQILRQLPDLSALINLRSLDLSGCNSLEDLPDLSAFPKLLRLRVEGTPNLTNPEAAATTRIVEFAHDDPELRLRVLAQTRARDSVEYFCEELPQWPKTVSAAQDPSGLLVHLMNIFSQFPDEERKRSILFPIDALKTLTGTKGLERSAWKAFWAHVRWDNDYALSTLDNFIESCDAESLDNAFLAECLLWLSRAPEDTRERAINLGKQLLDRLPAGRLHAVADEVRLFCDTLGLNAEYARWTPTGTQRPKE